MTADRYSLAAEEQARIIQKEKQQRDSIEKELTPEEEQRQANFRFQEQCQLMLRWEELTAQNGVEDSFLQQSRKAFYNNFAVIDHDQPYSFVNKLFNRGPDADILFDLSPEQLSILVPQVRIYKIYVDQTTKEEVAIELPFDDYLSRQEVANITKTGKGRGRGVGLKSFTWKTVGSTPANNFQFEANMSLHFQSVEDIFVTRDAKTVKFGNNKKTIDVSFSDLVIPKTQFKKNPKDGSRVWDPSFFKVKAVLGWKVPNLRGVNTFIPKAARDVLKRTHMSFLLNIFEHDMDIGDDGTVTLNIRFTTYPEVFASDPIQANILFPSTETKMEVERLTESINKLKFQLDSNSDIGEIRDEENGQSLATGVEGQEQSLSEGSPGSLNENQRVAIQKELEEKQKRLESYDNSRKTQSYRRILSGLYNRDRLKFIEVPKKLIERQIELRNAEGKDNAQEQIEANRTSKENTKEASGIVKEQTDLKKILSVSEISEPDDLSSALNSISRLNEQKLDKKNYQVVYFYFGDLLEVVLDGMFKKRTSKPDTFTEKEVKVLLGPITFYDYGSLTDYGVVQKGRGSSQERRYGAKQASVNLADIPISLKVFTNWFNENIVEKGLENYTFQEFISDCLNDLLIRAINTECYEFAPRQKIRLTYQPFSVPADQKRTDLFKSSTRINLSELEEVPFIHKEERVLPESVNMENYLLIHASVENPWNLKGDYEQDKKDGIYHLFYGNERGLVKNINFNRADKPYVRAANIANNSDQKILRQVYNATVEMFGNNLFSVGSQLRIIPSLGGGSVSLSQAVGDSKNRSRLSQLVDDLGIGGYFLVLDREDKVESGLFQTTLNVVWTAPSHRNEESMDEEDPGSFIVKEKVKSSRSNNNKQQTTAGNIGDNSVEQASRKLGEWERRNIGGGRRF